MFGSQVLDVSPDDDNRDSKEPDSEQGIHKIFTIKSPFSHPYPFYITLEQYDRAISE